MRPDNIFMSDVLCNATVKCTTVVEEWPARSDHLPIVTINMEPVVKAEVPRPNFRVTNWNKFRMVLADRLVGLEPEEPLRCEGEFYRKLEGLTWAIREVIDEKVLRVKLSPFTK